MSHKLVEYRHHEVVQGPLQARDICVPLAHLGAAMRQEGHGTRRQRVRGRNRQGDRWHGLRRRGLGSAMAIPMAEKRCFGNGPAAGNGP